MQKFISHNDFVPNALDRAYFLLLFYWGGFIVRCLNVAGLFTVADVLLEFNFVELLKSEAEAGILQVLG